MIIEANNNRIVVDGNKYVLDMHDVVGCSWGIFKFKVDMEIEGEGIIKISKGHDIIEISNSSMQDMDLESKILCIGENARFSFTPISLELSSEWKDKIFEKNGKLFHKWEMPKGARF